MKRRFLFIVFVFSINIHSQTSITIEELKLSNIKPSNTKTIDRGNDSLVQQTEEHIKKPYIEALLKIKNTSNISSVINPKQIKLSLTYRYNNNSYTSKLKFLVKQQNSFYMPDKVDLPEEEFILLYISDTLIELGSDLDIYTRKVKNFTVFLLEILPTLRFHYKEETKNTEINDIIINRVIVDYSSQ